MSLPDKEAIMSQVHNLAQEAREHQTTVGEALKTAANVSDSVAAPIYLGKATEFIPVAYILHFTTTTCVNCGCQTHESKFYAMNFIRSRVTGQHIRHLVPTDRALYNVPVERIPLRNQETPYCAECEVIDLSHLPPPPQAALVYDLEDMRLKGQRPPAKEPKKSHKATLDDLA